MPLLMIRNDITKLNVDAIVNAANSSLLGGGGVDGAIHKAAGPKLLEECRTLGGCEVGEAKLTKGYSLPANYIIHTVGPIWQGGSCHEEELLANCYRNSLRIALDKGLESIAFPLISTGAYGFPKNKALQIVIAQTSEFLLTHDMMVYLVVFDKTSFALSQKLFTSITQYIDDKYFEEHAAQFMRNSNVMHRERRMQRDFQRSTMVLEEAALKKRSLDDILGGLEETFSTMLLRLIDEKGLSDVAAYKRANVDRKLFSKIRSDVYYQPSKPTAIAFAIALELNLDQTRDLLRTAGYSLSHSNKFDVIIEYFIKHGNYNVFEINEALFAFDQNLLGM